MADRTPGSDFSPLAPPDDSHPLLRRTQRGRSFGTEGQTRVVDYSQIRTRVHNRLIEDLAISPTGRPPEVIRARIAELVTDALGDLTLSLTRAERQELVEDITHDVLGFGPLEPLLADPEITEIMINGPQRVFVERRGRITAHPPLFESTAHLLQVIERVVAGIGRRVDEASPMVDARLYDGSRVNVIVPPLALDGPVMTIRKFNKSLLTIEDLVRNRTMTADMVTFLRAAVRSHLNVLVSGGTGSGKTTTLNMLSGFIPKTERVVTIEDAAELHLLGEHVVRLEARPANAEGVGRITVRDLLVNALRMRPDRIIIGECRGPEALDMLQAMNTGHEGSMTTVHANSSHDALNRLETLVLMAGNDLPLTAVRDQIGSAIRVVVQQARLSDGNRRITSVGEVVHDRGEEPRIEELFVFEQTGVDDSGKVLGSHRATGVMPRALKRIEAQGESVSADIFQAGHSDGQGG